ncbi:MAG: HAD family hydrolase [Thermoleophilia bacterium]
MLLDAYGTLLTLEPPAPLLGAALAAAGHRHPAERVRAALRAEVLHYRANHDRGRDPESLAALRRECAGVLAGVLGPDVPPPERLAAMLVESLRFVLLPDAVAALDGLAALGVRLAVVSNWDHALPEVLDGLGVLGRFDAVVTSAAVGASKPDPRIFRRALELLEVPAARALHCGDLPDRDCLGARRAAVRAVLIDRSGAHPDGPCPRIAGLGELVALVHGDDRFGSG